VTPRHVVSTEWNGRDSDIQVQRYAVGGGLQWALTFNGGANESASRAAAAPDGGVYVAGTAAGPSNSDFLLLKYGRRGDLLVRQQFDATPRDSGVLVASAGPDVLALAGSAHNGSTYDLWVARVHPRGSLLWSRLHDSGVNDYPVELNVNSLGNVEVTYESVAGGREGGVFSLANVRYDKNGGRLSN
jgi:hypothetical protein